jgi:hypothetical protein
MHSIRVAAVFLILFAVSLQSLRGGPGQAAAPAANALAVKDEPHHHLLLENDYAHVYRFELAPHSSALLHLHPLPYFGIALGPADYVNAVQGKPETRATLEDAQISFSKGGFVHLVRTETDTRFYNFTVELTKPQGNPHNRCVKVIADGALDCPVEAAARPAGGVPAFETDEVLLLLKGLQGGESAQFEAATTPRLILILEDSEVSIETRGAKSQKLHGGEAFWLPANSAAEIVNAAKGHYTGKGKDKVWEEPKPARFCNLVFR